LQFYEHAYHLALKQKLVEDHNTFYSVYSQKSVLTAARTFVEIEEKERAGKADHAERKNLIRKG